MQIRFNETALEDPMNHSFLAGRRRLLQRSAGLVAANSLLGAVGAFVTRDAQAAMGKQVVSAPSPYGPIAPVPDGTTGLPLLALPEGFEYRSYGWAGDAMA